MAHADIDTALGAIHGKLDNHVYRTYRGRTFLQKKPEMPQARAAGQLETQQTFAGGSAYADRVKADPDLLAFYRKAGRSRELNYRQMAIRDYFSAPQVSRFNADDYRAETGGPLKVSALEKVSVARVHIALIAADGTCVLEGEARGIEPWVWDAPALPAGTPMPVRAIVNAYDLPGNVTTREFPLPAPTSPAAAASPASAPA